MFAMFSTREIELAAAARLQDYEQVTVPASIKAAHVEAELPSVQHAVWRALAGGAGGWLVSVGGRIQALGTITPKPSV